MAGLSDRVAIVTGGARGIGAATARGLAAGGCRVVVVDRCADDPSLGYALATPADLDEVVAACGGGDGRAVGIRADVRDQDALDGAVAEAVAHFDGLDIAVAAAGGIAGGRTLWETGDDVWSTMFGVNAEGVWRLARAAVPALLERPQPRHGRFVAVSSMGGSVGLPMLAPYVAAKHAVNGLVRSMAAELGPQGVTVNAVAPGSTTSAMLNASAAVYGLSTTAPLSVQHLLERPLDPEEVAALVVWLCGTSSSGVTGAVLPVDAGATAR